MVITSNAVCIKGDERTALGRVETMSVIWKVETACWTAALCLSGFRLRPRPSALGAGGWVTGGVPGELGLRLPDSLGQWETPADRRAGLVLLSQRPKAARSGRPFATVTSLASCYRSCCFHCGTLLHPLLISLIRSHLISYSRNQSSQIIPFEFALRLLPGPWNRQHISQSTQDLNQLKAISIPINSFFFYSDWLSPLLPQNPFAPFLARQPSFTWENYLRSSLRAHSSDEADFSLTTGLHLQSESVQSALLLGLHLELCKVASVHGGSQR